MTQKLSELFNLPESNTAEAPNDLIPTQEHLEVVDDAINKIDAALPFVNNLDTTDGELDDLSKLAQDTFKDLIDLGMNVEARYSGTILSTASSMLGHALSAKEAKINRKLKTIDLQLKKMRLDHQKNNGSQDPGESEDGQATVLDRNELLNDLLARAKQDQKPQ